MSDREQVFVADRRSALNFRIRPRLRWVFAGTLAVLLPKCLACVLGYVAVLAGLAAASPELCGSGANESPDGVILVVAGPVLVAGIGGALRLMAQSGSGVSENGTAKR